MPFQLHQAPDSALRYISNEKTKRCCGTFWAWACFLPTLGLSFCGRSAEKDNYHGIYPKPVSKVSENHLSTLIEKLQEIRNEAEVEYKKLQQQLQAEPGNRAADENAQRNEQFIVHREVSKTLALLHKALEEKKIERSYRDAISNAHADLKSKVDSIRSYTETLAHEEKRINANFPREGIQEPLIQNQAPAQRYHSVR